MFSRKNWGQNKNYDQFFTLCQLFYEDFIEASETANQIITLCQLFYENFIKASETATKGVLSEKVFLKISQNSQESICARVCFFNKVVGLSLQL